MENKWWLMIDNCGTMYDNRGLMVNDRGTVDKQGWSVNHDIRTMVDLWRGMVDYRGSVYDDILLLLLSSLEFFSCFVC